MLLLDNAMWRRVAFCWVVVWSGAVHASTTTSRSTTTSTSTSTSASDTDTTLLFDDAVSWLQSQKGIAIHPSIKMTHQGVFATEDIPAQTALLTLEPHHVIGLDHNHDKPTSMCDTARALEELYQQSSSSSSSSSNPLVQYWYQVLAPTLPAQWSPKAMSVMHTILGEQLEPQEFPASSATMDCHRTTTTTTTTSTTQSLTQALLFPDQDLPYIFPGWNFFRQQNGQGLFNVDFFPEYDDGTDSSSSSSSSSLPSLYIWKTTQDIAAGEELTVSLTDCHWCSDDDQWAYTTVEAFADTGVVPQFPQRWELSLSTVEPNDIPVYCEILDNETIVWWEEIMIIMKEEEDAQQSSSYTSHHQGFAVSLSTRAIWRGHIQRLRQMNLLEMTHDLPPKEATAIRDYVAAYQRALELAFVSTSGDYDSPAERAYWKALVSGNDTTTTNNANATVPMEMAQRTYDSLEYRTTETLESCLETCNHGSYASAYDDRTDVLQDSESFYQPIRFRYTTNPTTGDPDTCIFLASILQSCHSHRPNYHEPFAHYAAQYLDRDVKRILVLGGGDNMMVEEMLKYNDTLEFAIFMELDQKVVRESFRNYGVQPHFDNPKIQWWFGNAATGMLMVPEEWVGTFDLVLVDLLTFVVDITKVTPTTSMYVGRSRVVA